jgi:heat shock protein 1/8
MCASCPVCGAERLRRAVVQVMYNDEPTVFTPQQIAGMFFSKMKELVQVSTGQKGCDMVISVPPYYTDAQRHAVLDSCKIGVSDHGPCAATC